MKKVLIIDDCPDIVKFIRRFIRKLLFAHIDVCCDVHDLGEFLELHDYDVVITDLGMPHGGPIPYLLNYKKKDSCVIIVSAQNAEDIILNQNKLLDGGFTDVKWLQKPITLDKLKEFLSR